MITSTEIEKIARLARLAISPKEAVLYAQEISKTLSLINQMTNVDTTSVEPMSHPLDIHQRLRPDVTTENEQRDLLQSVAPQTEMGLYLVPHVIE